MDKMMSLPDLNFKNKNILKQLQLPRNKIVDELWPVIYILRIVGKAPFQKCSYGYSYTWRSYYFFHCLFLTTIYATVWFITIAHNGFGLPWFSFMLKSTTVSANAVVNNSSKIISLVGKAYFVIQPMSYLVDFVLPWFGFSSIADAFNNWTVFQSCYESWFCPLEFSLKKSRNIFLFWAILPSVLAIVLFIDEDLMKNRSLGFIWSFLLTFSMTFIPFTEDVLYNLHFRAVSQCFSMIENQVREFPLKDISIEVARGWLNVVQTLRRQHELVCKSYATHQLMSTFLSIILLTLYVFLLMQCLVTNFRGETSRVAAVCILYTFIISARIYCKCINAEGVTNNEHRLAKSLIPKISECNHVLVKMELQFLYTMMIQEPTKVTYGVTTFNRKFMLKMATQIISYILILIQFNVNILIDQSS